MTGSKNEWAEQEIAQRENEIAAAPESHTAVDSEFIEDCFLRPYRFAQLMQRAFPQREDCIPVQNEFVEVSESGVRLNPKARHHRYETSFTPIPGSDSELKLVVKEYIAAPILVIHPLIFKQSNASAGLTLRPLISKLVQNLTPWQTLGHIPCPEKIGDLSSISSVTSAVDEEELRKSHDAPTYRNKSIEWLSIASELNGWRKMLVEELTATWEMTSGTHEPVFDWLGFRETQHVIFGRLPILRLGKTSESEIVATHGAGWFNSPGYPERRQLSELHTACLFLPDVFRKILRHETNPYAFLPHAEQKLFFVCSGGETPAYYGKLSKLVDRTNLNCACSDLFEGNYTGPARYSFATLEGDFALYDRIHFDAYTRFHDADVDEPRGYDRVLNVAHCAIQLNWNTFLGDAMVRLRRPWWWGAIGARHAALDILLKCPDKPKELEAAVRKCRKLYHASDFSERDCFTMIWNIVEDALRILEELPKSGVERRVTEDKFSAASSLKRVLETAHSTHQLLPLTQPEVPEKSRECFPLIPSLEPLRPLWVPTTGQLYQLGRMGENCLSTYSKTVTKTPIWFFHDGRAVGMVAMTNDKLIIRECLDAGNRVTARSRELAMKIGSHLKNIEPEDIADDLRTVRRHST